MSSISDIIMILFITIRGHFRKRLYWYFK
jgi:hypothetical protein